MLHRSHAELYENVRDFHVAVVARDAISRPDDAEHGTPDEAEVVGTCGLDVVWANLAEVYALAVKPGRRGGGVGRKLVEACVVEARELGIRRLMSLTYEQAFFERLAFRVVDRQALPLKVWTQCVRCAKNQACDEIAMVRVLEDVPDLDAPRAVPPDPEHYVVPVPVRVTVRDRPVEPGRKMDEAPT
jgi:amino-acid N-acetyltransferase